jgi:hypothetical protein
MPVLRIPDEVRRVEPEVVLHMIAAGDEDARAAVRAFTGIARRIVGVSSGDVYRAYGVLMGLEAPYDQQFAVVFDAIRELASPPPDEPARRIGFGAETKSVTDCALTSE